MTEAFPSAFFNELRLPRTANMYALREPDHHSAPCLPGEIQLHLASRVQLHPEFDQSLHSPLNPGNRQNSRFLFSRSRLNIFSFLQSCLSQHAIEGSRRQIVASLPGSVTKPGLLGRLYWRWLPRVWSKNQPSCCSSLMTSRTFILKFDANYAFIASP